MNWSFFICAGITVVSSGVSGGYSLAAFRSATPDSRVAAMYALARSSALLVVAVVALIYRDVPFEAATAMAMILVQAFDALIGTRIRDRVKTVGPAATAFVNLVGLVWMLTRP